MKLTQFEIKTDTGFVVKGEYEGNENSKKIIIFSHGFGVARDAHGMFNEIGDELKAKYIVVRFDYTIVNRKENWTQAFSFSKQVEMLKTVNAYVRKIFNPEEVNIIGHSMGCLIIAMAYIKDIKKVLLLAGSSAAPYPRLRDHFAKRPETIINESATSSIRRSDGSTTYVESDFWYEMKDINPPELYKKLTGISEVSFVRALADQVITETNYEAIRTIPNLHYYEIDGGHDFKDEARKSLIILIKKLFL